MMKFLNEMIAKATGLFSGGPLYDAPPQLKTFVMRLKMLRRVLRNENVRLKTLGSLGHNNRTLDGILLDNVVMVNTVTVQHFLRNKEVTAQKTDTIDIVRLLVATAHETLIDGTDKVPPEVRDYLRRHDFELGTLALRNREDTYKIIISSPYFCVEFIYTQLAQDKEVEESVAF